MINVNKIYERRFGKDAVFRQKMYSVLCSKFFQKYISKNATVLDVAAGYCEFINNIQAKHKIALDINPDIRKFADKSVKIILAPSTDMSKIYSNTIDNVFISNFFEHITKEDIIKTLNEIHRVLKKGGKLMILQPNIRYSYNDYWMFFDHITPLDDRSLCEVLELTNFKIVESRPKFLPYSTKSKLPKSIILLRIYLKLPILQRIMGKQAFVVAQK
jgi:ubiquinone/menaquinone biosynthesis C-methylase UbiE